MIADTLVQYIFLTLADIKDACGNEKIECKNKNFCIQNNASLHMKQQCSDDQEYFPHEHSDTECPSYYTCKHKKKLPLSNLTCVSASEICDGIPQCPHWDDEANCPLFCPELCLSCVGKRYVCPPKALAEIPQSASFIDMSGQQINIENFCSTIRVKLRFLNLSSCGLTDHSCVLDTKVFPMLDTVDMSRNKIRMLLLERYFHKVPTLILDYNPIQQIVKNIEIRTLHMRNCSIRKFIFAEHKVRNNDNLVAINTLPDGYIPSLGYQSCSLTHLDLGFNFIVDLSPFWTCIYLAHINLEHNNVQEIPTLKETFKFMTFLNLNYNRLSTLKTSDFSGMENTLETFLVKGNAIEDLEDSDLTLTRLQRFDISLNNLQSVGPRAFHGFVNLEELNLESNKITTIHIDAFLNIKRLKLLTMRNNRLTYIQKGLFRAQPQLKYLDVSGNNIHMNPAMFFGLGVLENLIVQNFSLCCIRPKSVQLRNCVSFVDIFSSCSNLLGVGYISVYIWFIATCLLCGNVCAIYGYAQKRKWLFNRPRYILSSSLILTDLLFVVYLYIISFIDISYRGKYGTFHDVWRQSKLCTAGGIIATVSIETSLLTTIAITVDKLMFFKYNLRMEKFVRLKSAIILVFIWMLAIVAALYPQLMISPDFYSRSPLCVPLSLTSTGTEYGGWQYSVSLFIGFNSLLAMFTIGGQLLIYKELNGLDQHLRRKLEKDIRISRSLTLTIISVTLPLVPIVVLGKYVSNLLPCYWLNQYDSIKVYQYTTKENYIMLQFVKGSLVLANLLIIGIKV